MHPKEYSLITTLCMKDFDMDAPEKSPRYLITMTTLYTQFPQTIPYWDLDFCWFCHKDTGFHMCHKLQMICWIYC